MFPFLTWTSTSPTARSRTTATPTRWRLAHICSVESESGIFLLQTTGIMFSKKLLEENKGVMSTPQVRNCYLVGLNDLDGGKQ